jgi:hypothetical protein
VVNTPAIPLKLEASTVLPVTVAPETLVVKTLVTPVSDVNCPIPPVTVVPESKEVNVPVAPVTDVNTPVAPVMLIPETRPKSPETTFKNVAFIVLPVIVVPET